MAKQYIKMLLSNGMVPAITKPTNVTDQLKTIIDHFITNISSLQIKPGVFQIDIKNHYLVFCAITYNSIPLS